MKKVSEKNVVKLLKLTRKYYADVWRSEEGNRELLDKRFAVARELENESGAAWNDWDGLVSGVYGLCKEVTDREMIAIVRSLGYYVVEDDE